MVLQIVCYLPRWSFGVTMWELVTLGKRGGFWLMCTCVFGYVCVRVCINM